MTVRKTRQGFYVTARLDGRTAWLCGPFDTLLQATRMIGPVWRAVDRSSDDPRFAFAGFGTARMTIPSAKELPPGNMPLEWLSIDDVIHASKVI